MYKNSEDKGMLDQRLRAWYTFFQMCVPSDPYLVGYRFPASYRTITVSLSRLPAQSIPHCVCQHVR